MRRGGVRVAGRRPLYLAVLGWILFGRTSASCAGPPSTSTRPEGRDAAAVRPLHYEIVLVRPALRPARAGWPLRLTGRPPAWVAVGCVWVAVMVELAQVALLDRSGSAVDVIARRQARSSAW